LASSFATLWDSWLGGGHSPSAEKGVFHHPCRLFLLLEDFMACGSDMRQILDSFLVSLFHRLTSLHENSVRVRDFAPESLKSCGFHGAVGPSDGILRSRALVGVTRFHGSRTLVGRGERVTVRGVVGEREALRNSGLTEHSGQSQISRGVRGKKMTGYFVTMKSRTGREFTRCTDSAISRELFIIAALGFGASIVKQWIGQMPSESEA